MYWQRRAYYPIVMPVDSMGNGPVEMSDASEILWEVWDDNCEVHGVYKSLPEAEARAEELNKAEE